MLMAEILVSSLSIEQALHDYAGKIKDSTRGFGLKLSTGAIVQFGEARYFYSGDKATDASGNLKNTNYFGNRSRVTGRTSLIGPVGVASLTRCTYASGYPTNEEVFVDSKGTSFKVLRSADLLEALMEEAKLSEEIKEFNRSLYLPKSSSQTAQDLEGRTFKVVGESTTVWRKKFNSNNDANWGSQKHHWDYLHVLFFEDITDDSPEFDINLFEDLTEDLPE